MNRKWMIISSLLAACGIVVIIVWYRFNSGTRPYTGREPFDSVAWQAPSHRTNHLRLRMVDDLISSRQLHDRTREQVTRLLGEPEKTSYFKEWDLVYWLGPERGYISADSEWLVIRLDDRKKVAEYRVVRD